jgi:flagellar biosynthesis protein FlhG
VTDEVRPTDWEVLGLDPGADAGEVYRAYLYRMSLYDPDSIATYTLHDEDDRTALLDRIETAYRRITGAAPPAPAVEPDTEDHTVADAPAGPPPPVDDNPGAHLKHHRQRRKITLEQLAVETKIRATLLEQLESEDFSALPAPVYVRGFVIQCAKALDLADPEGLATSYLSKMERERQPDD